KGGNTQRYQLPVLLALLAEEVDGLPDRLLRRRGREARLGPNVIRPAAYCADEFGAACFDTANQGHCRAVAYSIRSQCAAYGSRLSTIGNSLRVSSSESASRSTSFLPAKTPRLRLTLCLCWSRLKRQRTRRSSCTRQKARMVLFSIS